MRPSPRGPCPHLLFVGDFLREFQGYEFGWLLARVGYGVGIVAGEPFAIAGFEVAGHGALAFYVAADVEVAYGYQQVRAGVMVPGRDAAGLEFEFGDADAIFDEEDLFGPAGEGFEAAVFVPFRGRGAEGFVVYDFYGYVAEGLIGSIACYVSEGGRGEAGLAVLEFYGYWWLVFYGVDYFCRA